MASQEPATQPELTTDMLVVFGVGAPLQLLLSVVTVLGIAFSWGV